MAKVVTNRKGKKVVLLNPSEKSNKFAIELKRKVKFTNDGEVKRDSKGNPIRVNDTQSAFRAGYLQARKDNARAFNSKRKSNKRYDVIAIR